MTPSVLRELGSRPIAEVAAALGMTPGRRGSWGPCPACRADRRGSERPPRGPLGVSPSGKGWHCWVCHAKGDGGSLASLALVGVAHPDAEQVREVEAWAETHGLCLPRGAPRSITTPYRPPPPPAPEPPPSYPPPHLIDDVRRTHPADTRCVVEVVAWQRSRGLGDMSLWARARITARSVRALVPAGYPLVVPLCDAAGETRSVHCRRADEERPKTRSPAGFDVRGLFFADSVALAMLRGTPPGAGLAVVVEGVTDYLRACQIAPPDVAVLGGISGSFVAIGALACLPADVWVLTDADEAGDRYAEQVAAGCPRAVRVRPPDGQDLGNAGWTWDDVVRAAAV